MPKQSAVSGISGSARIRRLSGVAIAAAEKHGKRADLKGPARSVVDVPPLTSSGLDLADLYARHVEGAAIHKSATKALHMLIQFPTELVDGEDPERMLDLARRFGQQVFGDDAIFADRVDRDEKSRHVVDLFVAPKYQKTTKHTAKLAVSTTRHLKELAAKHGRAPTLRGQGQALQDAFAAFLQGEGYTKTKRGEPKKLLGEDWREPEEIEADRLADLGNALLEAFQPPSRADLLRPDRYYQIQSKRIAQAAAPLLAAASQTATERVRRVEVEKSAAREEKRASEAVRGAEDEVRRASNEVQLSATAYAALERQIERLTKQLKGEKVAKEMAEEAVKTAKADATVARTQLTQFIAFIDSTRQTLKRVLGDKFEIVRTHINHDWAKHPDNPEQLREDKPAPSSRSAGPSLG